MFDPHILLSKSHPEVMRLLAEAMEGSLIELVSINLVTNPILTGYHLEYKTPEDGRPKQSTSIKWNGIGKLMSAEFTDVRTILSNVGIPQHEITGIIRAKMSSDSLK